MQVKAEEDLWSIKKKKLWWEFYTQQKNIFQKQRWTKSFSDIKAG